VSPSLSLGYATTTAVARKALEVASAGHGAAYAYGQLCKTVDESDVDALERLLVKECNL
jgi:hypothetical protein